MNMTSVRSFARSFVRSIVVVKKKKDRMTMGNKKVMASGRESENEGRAEKSSCSHTGV
jgi:hypothetical protein